jgi:hypothetical protein
MGVYLAIFPKLLSEPDTKFLFLSTKLSGEHLSFSLSLLNVCVPVVRVPGWRSRVPEFLGSIFGATRFFCVAVGLERGPLSPCEDQGGTT